MKSYIIKGFGIQPANDLYVVFIEISLKAKNISDAIDRANIVANFKEITECREG